MRMFSAGEPFEDVDCEYHIPGEDALAEMRDDNARCVATGDRLPTFSEGYLYPRVGKDDARFILGVADEYSRIIDLLGPELTAELLQARLTKTHRISLRGGLRSLLRPDDA